MADIKAVDFYGDAKKVFAKSEYNKGYEKGREDAYEEFLKILNEIYDCVWDRDIPSAICPEYIEHHRDCLEIMTKIKDEINYCYGKLKERSEAECGWKCTIDTKTGKRKETCPQCAARHLAKENKGD